MKASFGKEIASKLNRTPNVWSVDAMFTDVSGSATFTDKETKKVTSYLSEVGKLFKKLDAATLNGISDNALLHQKVMTHFNTKVRDGQKITNVKSHVRDLIAYIERYYEKEAGKRSTAKGKTSQLEKRDDLLKYFSKPNVNNLENIFLMMNLLIDAKEMIISKMDQASNITTLLRTKDGFQVTSPEGYVAIDNDGSALKLVNRMQFSHANFSSDYIKGWEKG